MKRLFSYIVSIALIFLILASCTDANKGISEEEQLDADLKAVGIIDSLGYGSLVVQAVYDKENGLSFSSADSSTLYIEFTNYRGKALQPDGDIEEIESGILAYVFAENTRSVTKTYTVRTVSPLVVLYKGEANAVPVEFESESTPCNIEFKSTEAGITGISSNSVQFTKPSEMSTITVDNVDAAIEEFVSGITAEEEEIVIVETPVITPPVPEPELTVEELTQIAADVFNAIDAEKICADLLIAAENSAEGSNGLLMDIDQSVASQLISTKVDQLLGNVDKYPNGYIDFDAKMTLSSTEGYSYCFKADGYTLIGSMEFTLPGKVYYADVKFVSDSYSVSTVDELTVIIPDGSEHKVSFSGLTGSMEFAADPKMSLDLDISLDPAKLTLPVDSDVVLTVDDKEIPYSAVFKLLDENKPTVPIDPPESEGGETEETPEPEV